VSHAVLEVAIALLWQHPSRVVGEGHDGAPDQHCVYSCALLEVSLIPHGILFNVAHEIGQELLNSVYGCCLILRGYDFKIGVDDSRHIQCNNGRAPR